MTSTDTARRPAGYAKSHATRAQILAAAREEASAGGLHRASSARIAARADVAVGSVNYHFGSRDALLRAVMTDLMADLARCLAEADPGEGTDFFARHRAELLGYVQYVRVNPAHVRLADEIKFLDPELYADGVADWVATIRARLRDGIAEGSVRPLDDAELTAQAHFLLGARHFLEEMLSTSRPGRDEDGAVVDAYLGLVRDGLHAAPASKEKGR
jgi:AcrR family transcriptional regulator